MSPLSLAEILAEGERLEKMYRKGPSFWGADSEFRTDSMAIISRLLPVARAAVALFSALDYVTPGWRDETCVITEDSDEVNVAWCGLENALENPKAGQPPEGF